MAWLRRLWKKKLLRYLFLGLFVLQALVSTVAANFVVPAVLRTWNDGYLNYRWAVSFVPGLVHVFGVDLRHMDRNIEWNTTLGSATTWVNLMALTRQEFHAYFVSTRNVTFHFGLKKRHLDKEAAPWLPKFPGIPHHDPAKENQPSDGKKWGIRIDNVSLSNLKEIWFDKLRFDGRSGINGGFQIVPDKEVWVGPVDLQFETGRFHMQGETLLEPFAADFHVMVNPFDPNAPDIDEMKFLDVDAKIRSQVSTLDFLNRYFKELKWLRAVSGGGPLTLDFKVGKGKLLPPAELSIRSKETLLEILDNRLRGDARILGSIHDFKDGKKEATLSLTLDGFTLTDALTDEKHLEGDGFKIIAKTNKLAIDSLFSKLSVDLELEKAKVSNLTFYNRYLPKQSGLAIQDGVGTVTANFHGNSEGTQDSGSLLLVANDAKVKYADLDLNGDIELKALLKNGAIRKKRFDISGTQMKFSNVVSRGGDKATQGWWGQIWFPQAKFQLNRPLEASGLVRCKLRDVKPLLAIYAVKNPLPDMLGPVLNVQGLNASGDFQISKEIVDFQNIDIVGDNLRLRGHVRLLPWESHITLLAQHKMITVALDRIDGESRIILNDAENWYLKQAKFTPVSANEIRAPITTFETKRKDTPPPKKNFGSSELIP